MARNWVWHSRQAVPSTFSFCPVTSWPVAGMKSLITLIGLKGLPVTESRTTSRCTFDGSYTVPAAATPAVMTLANR